MRFLMDVRLVDAETLASAAIARAVEDGLSPQEAVALVTPEGKLDMGAALVMLLDPGSLPGVEILESWTEGACSDDDGAQPEGAGPASTPGSGR